MSPTGASSHCEMRPVSLVVRSVVVIGSSARGRSIEAEAVTSAAIRRRPFRFGAIVNTAADSARWAEICRRVEDTGCTTVYVSDHFGDQVALIPALAASLAASTTVRVARWLHAMTIGTRWCMRRNSNRGSLVEGTSRLGYRCRLARPGVRQGRDPIRPPIGASVAGPCEAVTIMKGLFADGAFSFSGVHYTVRDLDGRPKPTQRPHPPLTIGAQGRRLLSFAAREADVIGASRPASAAVSSERFDRVNPLRTPSTNRSAGSASFGRSAPGHRTQHGCLPARGDVIDRPPPKASHHRSA